jgi:hypothetical protein
LIWASALAVGAQLFVGVLTIPLFVMDVLLISLGGVAIYFLGRRFEP